MEVGFFSYFFHDTSRFIAVLRFLFSDLLLLFLFVSCYLFYFLDLSLNNEEFKAGNKSLSKGQHRSGFDQFSVLKDG